MATIYVPANWRVFTAGEKKFCVEAPTAREAIDSLAEQFPALRERIFSLSGSYVSYINIYVDDVDIRSHQNRDAPISPSSEIRIIPAVAGG